MLGRRRPVASGDCAIGSSCRTSRTSPRSDVGRDVDVHDSMLPRAAVASRTRGRVLETESSVAPPDNPVSDLPQRSTVEFRTSASPTLARSRPCSTGCRSRRAGADHSIIGSTGSGKDHVGQPGHATVRRHVWQCARRRRRCRRLHPDALWSRIGYVPQKAYLFRNDRVQTSIRLARGKPTSNLWQALEIAQAASFVQAMPHGLDHDNQGGTKRLGRPAPTLAIARALVVQPESTFSTTLSRRSISPPMPASGRRWRRPSPAPP